MPHFFDTSNWRFKYMIVSFLICLEKSKALYGHGIQMVDLGAVDHFGQTMGNSPCSSYDPNESTKCTWES